MGTLSDSSLRPSCSWRAVKNEGKLELGSLASAKESLAS